jgi:hypothetical protein
MATESDENRYEGTTPEQMDQLLRAKAKLLVMLLKDKKDKNPKPASFEAAK